MKIFKAVAVGAGLAVAALPVVSAAQSLTTVNMINPLPRSTNFFPLVVGEALGYFEAEGVRVNLLPSDTSIPYVAFLQNGQADLAMLDPFEAVNAVNAGIDIRLVYEAMQNAPEGIAVPMNSTAQSMADLAGTTVGLVSDRDLAFLQAALNTAGMSTDDVRTVVLGEAGPTLAAAMRNGTVSALAGAAPDWLALIVNGIEVRLITPEELLASPANNFVTTPAIIDAKGDAILGFLRAWNKGMHAVTVDQEAVAEMLRRAVPEEWENEAAGQMFLEMSIDMNLSVTELLGATQPDVWTSIQPQMLESGGIEQIVDVARFLDDRFTGPANDFDRDQVAADIAAWREANM